MMKMVDLGKGRESATVEAADPKSPAKWYPSVNLSEKQLPVLKALCKDKKVGQFPIKAKIMMEVEIGVPRAYGNGDIDYSLELKKACMVDGKAEEKETKE